MKKRPNKATRELEARMREFGCIICKRPAVIHHITGAGMGLKSEKFFPLCPTHHTDGGFGNAVHSGTETWEAIFGTQEELFNRTMERLNGRL